MALFAPVVVIQVGSCHSGCTAGRKLAVTGDFLYILPCPPLFVLLSLILRLHPTKMAEQEHSQDEVPLSCLPAQPTWATRRTQSAGSTRSTGSTRSSWPSKSILAHISLVIGTAVSVAFWVDGRIVRNADEERKDLDVKLYASDIVAIVSVLATVLGLLMGYWSADKLTTIVEHQHGLEQREEQAHLLVHDPPENHN